MRGVPPVLLQALHRLGMLGLVLVREYVKGPVGTFLCFRHPYLVERLLHFGLDTIWSLVQHIGRLVYPAALHSGLRIDLSQCCPESHGLIPYGQLGSIQPPAPVETSQ